MKSKLFIFSLIILLSTMNSANANTSSLSVGDTFEYEVYYSEESNFNDENQFKFEYEQDHLVEVTSIDNDTEEVYFKNTQSNGSIINGISEMGNHNWIDFVGLFLIGFGIETVDSSLVEYETGELSFGSAYDNETDALNSTELDEALVDFNSYVNETLHQMPYFALSNRSLYESLYEEYSQNGTVYDGTFQLNNDSQFDYGLTITGDIDLDEDMFSWNLEYRYVNDTFANSEGSIYMIYNYKVDLTRGILTEILWETGMSFNFDGQYSESSIETHRFNEKSSFSLNTPVYISLVPIFALGILYRAKSKSF